MERHRRPGFFKESLKSESYFADEIVNIFLLRPIAAVIVSILYPTRITPNQVTIASVFIGFAASFSYSYGTPAAVALAGLLILGKDILDDADGQLARAKRIYSRLGRFLDSIGDFTVNVLLFTGITLAVHRAHPSVMTVLLGFLSFSGITLRVSYHVYYQVSFLHLEERYKLNRITEDITDGDREGDRLTLSLQRIFLLIYGWQDKMMAKIDKWCMGKNSDERLLPTWYSDRLALRLSGLLGFGTEYTILAACSLMNAVDTYLLINVFVMNGIWIVSIFYRRVILRKNL